MTPILFATAAPQEFEAAIRWYELRREGLGAELYDAIVAALELIAAHPEIGTASRVACGDAQDILTTRRRRWQRRRHESHTTLS